MGIGDRFPTTKELLLTFPLADQTKAVFGARLLEAEKNAKVTADLDALTMAATQSVALGPPPGPGAAPASANVAMRGTAPSRGSAPGRHPCTYVRKFPGKGGKLAGSVCGASHKSPKDCWARMFDQWLASNPGKTAADLPNRRLELMLSKQAKQKAGSSSASTSSGSSPQAQIALLQQLIAELTSTVQLPDSNENDDGTFRAYQLAPRKSENQRATNAQCSVTASPVTVALDSGVTASCFHQGGDFKPLAQPITVRGALPG